MINEIIILRHGESEHQVKGLTGGWTNTGLTQKGMQQAHKLRKYIINKLEADSYTIYSSDLLRAKETSEIVFPDEEIIYTDKLREFNYGKAVNMRSEDAKKIEKKITSPIEDWKPYDGAESWKDLTLRVESFLHEVGNNDKIVCITHVNTAQCIVQSWLNLVIDCRIGFDFSNCSFSKLCINSFNERVIVKLNEDGFINDIDYLQE